MGVYEDLNNPDLFKENAPGNYFYTETAYGKTASGQLTLDVEVQRDPAAQRAAGGEDRRNAGNEYGVDDGGHLIGARFGGSTSEENLTPQDRNLNRGQYKGIENGWAAHLEAGDKVYVKIESYTGDGSDRPTNYMGYAIIEHTDENGNTTRDVEYFSVNNESRAEQENWAAAEASYCADHPEAVVEDMQDNTAMPYIWNEETGKAEANPYYESESVSTYAPESTEDYAVESTTSYAPEGAEDYANESTADYAAGGSAGSDYSGTTGSGPDYSGDTDSGGSSADSGMDMD